MKKIISLLLCVFIITGCFKRDTMEDINIYTTVYPIEYITERLYGDNSTIRSIYPDGVNLKEYLSQSDGLTEKQIKEYANSSLFIFNGLSDEADYVVKFFKYNKNLKIIDTTQSMKYTYEIEELWLDPANFLMLAQNIRDGLNEYIYNHYLKTEIDNNYEQLKIDISELEAKLRKVTKEADKKTIVTSNNLFNFLTKYDIEVISLDEDNDITERQLSQVNSLIDSGKIKYIYVPEHEELNKYVKDLESKGKIKVIYFHTLENITETERNNKDDYITLMNENIDLLREELYTK